MVATPKELQQKQIDQGLLLAELQASRRYHADQLDQMRESINKVTDEVRVVRRDQVLENDRMRERFSHLDKKIVEERAKTRGVIAGLAAVWVVLVAVAGFLTKWLF